MAGGDVAQRERKTKGKKKKKKGRRLGVRIDMTPLVDVAFLLLTFFMLTTSMSRPQTMEINLPPDKDVKVDVAESNLLTLRINKEGAIYWSAGIGAPKLLPAGTLPRKKSSLLPTAEQTETLKNRLNELLRELAIEKSGTKRVSCSPVRLFDSC